MILILRQLERLRMKQSDDAKKKEAEQNRRKILSLLEDEEMNLEAAEKEKMRKESEVSDGKYSIRFILLLVCEANC